MERIDDASTNLLRRDRDLQAGADSGDRSRRRYARGANGSNIPLTPPEAATTVFRVRGGVHEAVEGPSAMVLPHGREPASALQGSKAKPGTRTGHGTLKLHRFTPHFPIDSTIVLLTAASPGPRRGSPHSAIPRRGHYGVASNDS